MGYYKVLSTPLPFAKEGYKGLYRGEPSYGSGTNKRFLSMWDRYGEYVEPLKNMGITMELTVDELKEFANLAA